MTGWSKDFFVSNRRKLAGRINGGLAVLAGYVEVQRRGDMSHRFSQESNMWYLCGIEEPGWRLIYDGTRDHAWLVRPERDDIQRIFDGGLSDQRAIEISGADEVVSANDQELLLRQLTRKHSTVHTIDPKRAASQHSYVPNPALADLHSMLSRVFNMVSDLTLEMANLRAIKSDEEIAAIKKAVGNTVEAFKEVKSILPELNYEYEIEAEFTYRFRRKNLDHAYDPIVASGANACTLHYINNSAKKQSRSAALIDIGAEYNGYCADVTRTYAWGKPTKRLIELHAALESAQHEIINRMSPAMPIADYLRMVDDVMKKHMIEVGLLANENDEKYRKYFPHSVSHGLGVDVHDSLGESRTLDPGMVLTVEPGIYIPEEGIGIRIEDDVLVAKNGIVNLSGKLSTSLLD